MTIHNHIQDYDANDTVRYLRDYAPYTPPDVEPTEANDDGRGGEMLAGVCLFSAIACTLIAVVVAVWP